jgi:hypothetical protein
MLLPDAKAIAERAELAEIAPAPAPRLQAALGRMLSLGLYTQHAA